VVVTRIATCSEVAVGVAHPRPECTTMDPRPVDITLRSQGEVLTLGILYGMYACTYISCLIFCLKSPPSNSFGSTSRQHRGSLLFLGTCLLVLVTTSFAFHIWSHMGLGPPTVGRSQVIVNLVCVSASYTHLNCLLNTHIGCHLLCHASEPGLPGESIPSRSSSLFVTNSHLDLYISVDHHVSFDS
jgi:hypothetical protein